MPHGPKDFEESLHILEGSFVDIINQRVSFVNPSLKDYLSSYLRDVGLLTLRSNGGYNRLALKALGFRSAGTSEPDQAKIVRDCIALPKTSRSLNDERK